MSQQLQNTALRCHVEIQSATNLPQIMAILDKHKGSLVRVSFVVRDQLRFKFPDNSYLHFYPPTSDKPHYCATVLNQSNGD
jgi:hypothetical protein